MPSPRFPIPQGTLDMLILQILSLEPAHGYGIAQRLEQISRSVVQVNQGSLYPRSTAWSRKAGCAPSGNSRRPVGRPSSTPLRPPAAASLRSRRIAGRGSPARST